ncbi:hypothetical protein XNC1_3693 [Xenorhabdus nematophila ATCC 19061]|uniref:Teneurin-like YD-shell domain-containing protein n=1 Tax=Xenorhabdus nematophila (strain ATCC 19061 / DSM 3370 / CCUG 14189 / LMG 1036 / NCIMB 9965 / AN6) TaxID=406817 RepID=D3VAU9_XENNA|nr:RHS repeat-associated core domain-containing protein [Xenorhabdus nematophila]CBJ91724.1 hypothetical protein XNC1_3693 [Xenorhabdus nematophila ATCC 19061]CEK24543.1 hypothetical protein XNC2_3549 [Xenorhabdus nematophila AN6/1]
MRAESADFHQGSLRSRIYVCDYFCQKICHQLEFSRCPYIGLVINKLWLFIRLECMRNAFWLFVAETRWNSQNQLTGVLTLGGQQWEYRYDAFGRRIEKACQQAGSRTTYLWDGDQPAEIREYRHHRLYSIRHLVFDGWQLLAQQVQFFTPNPENRSELIAGEVQTQYAVCATTGEPLALFDPQGHRVWRQPQQSLYGMQLKAAGENAELNPEMQFAGQWLDAESGLVYNRFRYFSPEASVYLTPDPLQGASIL